MNVATIPQNKCPQVAQVAGLACRALKQGRRLWVRFVTTNCILGAVVGCSSGSAPSSGSGGTTLTQQVPAANAGGPYTGIAGTAVSFSGSGSSDPQGEALTYAWSFGDKSTGTGSSPTHTYSTAGTYAVSLTVTDTSNLSATASSRAMIAAATQQAPVANAGGPYTGTAGTAVSFNGSGSSDPQGEALTYAWSFGDNSTGTGSSPAHTYSTAGTYTVSLTVTDTSNLTATASSSATIGVPPQQISTTGSWNGYLTSSGGITSSLVANLTQTGSSVTGQAQIYGSQLFDASTSFEVDGSVSSLGALTVSGTQNQTVFSYSGTATSDQNGSTGNYTVTGPASEQGQATLLHPPVVSGTYSGTFQGGDVNGTTTLSLSLTPTVVKGSSTISLSGTGIVNGLQTACGVSPNFTFSGNQAGTTVTGQLIQNGQIWAQLGGYTGTNGSTLTGHAVLTQGYCSDFTVNGSLTNPNIPGGVEYPSGDVGAVTVIVQNIGIGTGTVTVTGGGDISQTMYCSGAPTPYPITPVTCGTIVFPDGSTAVQFDALATPTQNPVTYLSPMGPCGYGGESLPETAWSCWDPIYNVPQSGTTILFQIGFGDFGHQNPVLTVR